MCRNHRNVADLREKYLNKSNGRVLRKFNKNARYDPFAPNIILLCCWIRMWYPTIQIFGVIKNGCRVGKCQQFYFLLLWSSERHL